MINVGNAYFTGFEKRKSNYKYLDYSHPLINFFNSFYIINQNKRNSSFNQKQQQQFFNYNSLLRQKTTINNYHLFLI